jgi:hypothetical protein
VASIGPRQAPGGTRKVEIDADSDPASVPLMFNTFAVDCVGVVSAPYPRRVIGAR